MESKGIVMYNKGDRCIIRAIVTLYTLRHFWRGNITFFLEEPYPKEFEEVCKYFDVDIIHVKRNDELKALTRKTETFLETPYDLTLWIDADVVVLGLIDEMFELLEDNDVVIPHFAGWISSGRIITKRIKRYEGIVEQHYIDEALKGHPAINTGIVAYRKCQFLQDWVELTRKGNGKMFIADEVAFQVLYPSYPKIHIAPMKYNVSVKHDPGTEDKRIIHYHGQKHCLNFELCNLWKDIFEHMRMNDIANINSFLKYSDRRLKQYLLKGEGLDEDVTIVTACDENYLPILELTFENWRQYKNIDKYPVIVFVHGIPPFDERLKFLKKPNVRIIPWEMQNADNHREEMLSSFVFGTAEFVDTPYWLKLDADSFATDDRPFITDEMKKFGHFVGHKWGYSRPEHIKQLDAWAKEHSKGKLKNAQPMIEQGRIEKNRFYHNRKRTISFIQLHRTKFTKFCVGLLGERKLPAPSQDTFMFYISDRFDPQYMGVMNFKRDYGFTQGNGRKGVEVITKQLEEVDKNFEQKTT